MTAKRTVIVPDSQIPFDDRKALKAVINFIGEYGPDEVVHIGDLIDLPQPSRWNKDTRGEFEGSVYRDSGITKTRFLEPLRAVYDGPVGIHEGNHDERARVYLEKYAPALAGTDAFNMEVLLDFDKYGVDLLPTFYEIAPGWVSTHGHKGGIRLNQIAGNTALNAAKKFGKSVIMGHTHRLGMLSFTRGYDGKTDETLTGVEVGNLMDMRQASYLKGGTANWQQGFVILHQGGKVVRPELIPITNRAFTVDGHTWKI